jgi:hypothetical protein
MTAPEIILLLVQRFNDHRISYLAGKYNETQLRRDFLDPFFAALGWDVFNQKNYSERYREVFHEVSVEVEGGAKAADYAFRVGEKTVFLVERMLALHKQSPRTPQEKEFLQRDIASTDQAIDTFVYQLYGLTEEEIKIVEGK